MTKIEIEGGGAAAVQLSAAEEQALHVLFKEADDNKDGTLDYQEVSNFIAEKLGAGREGEMWG